MTFVNPLTLCFQIPFPSRPAGVGMAGKVSQISLVHHKGVNLSEVLGRLCSGARQQQLSSPRRFINYLLQLLGCKDLFEPDNWQQWIHPSLLDVISAWQKQKETGNSSDFSCASLHQAQTGVSFARRQMTLPWQVLNPGCEALI